MTRLFRKAAFEHLIHPRFDIRMYMFPFTCQPYYKCIIFHVICVAGTDPVAYSVAQFKFHQHADDALAVVLMDFRGNLGIDLLQPVVQDSRTQLFERFRQFPFLFVILFIKFVTMDQCTDIMTRSADNKWYGGILMALINDFSHMYLAIL